MVAQAQEEQTIVRKLGKVEQPGAAHERKNKNIRSINLTKSARALHFVLQVSSFARDDLGVGWGGCWRVSRGTWDGSLASTGLYSHSLVFVFVCVSVFVFVFLPFLLSSSLSMFLSLFRFSWLCRCGCSCICLCFVSLSLSLYCHWLNVSTMLIIIIRSGSNMSRLRTFFSRTRSRCTPHRQHRNSYCRCRQKDSTVGIVVVSDICKTFRSPLRQIILQNWFNVVPQRDSCLAIIPNACSAKLQPLHQTIKEKFKVSLWSALKLAMLMNCSGWSREQVPELGWDDWTRWRLSAWSRGTRRPRRTRRETPGGPAPAAATSSGQSWTGAGARLGGQHLPQPAAKEGGYILYLRTQPILTI